MTLTRNYGSLASAQWAHDNAVDPIDEQYNPFEYVTQDELDEAKAEFFATGECDLCGVPVSIESTDKLQELIQNYDDELGEDWMLNVVELPYDIKLHEAKEKVWSVVCDYVQEKCAELSA